MKAITLAATHYAAAWKTDEIRLLSEVDDLGRRYAELPAEIEVGGRCVSNPAKQDLLLELCQAFHPYLMKYLVMIRCGHVPIVAFKGMETEEIYDVLMEQMVRAIKQYDPTYTEKVKRVVEVIDHELKTRPRFTAADVNRYIDLDCDRYIRLLCRRGFSSASKDRMEETIFLSPGTLSVFSGR